MSKYVSSTIRIPTGASSGYVLTSDGIGRATWNAVGGGSTSFLDGTASAPGIYFTSEPGTGLYRPANGQIGVELTGVNYATFTTSGLNLVTGSTLNVGVSGTTSPLNVYGLITGSNGLTINSGNVNFSGPSTTFTGNMKRTPLQVTTTTSLTSTSSSYVVATSGTFTITLPDIQTTATNGTEFFITNMGTGLVTLTVANTGSEMFDNTGNTSVILAQYDRLHLISFTNTVTSQYIWQTY